MKKIAFLSILLALGMVACGVLPFGSSSSNDEAPDAVAQIDEPETSPDESAEVEASTPTPASEEMTEDSATATPEEATDAAASATTDGETSAEATCTVDPLGLPKNEAIADLMSSDWFKHEAGDEAVTIVEYGDFQ